MVGPIIIPIFTDEDTEAQGDGVTRSHRKRKSQDLSTAVLASDVCVLNLMLYCYKEQD